MGTITFPTDKTPGQVLQDELCGDGVKIRMFTTDHESACVALSLELAKLDDQARADIGRMYDIPTRAKYCYTALIVKQSGLNGRGRRYVSLKVMGEEMGPYYTGGASAQLLAILTPLKANSALSEHAAAWRARAASGKAVFA